MRHPIIRSIHAYWQGLAQGRAAPNRTEIEPRALGSALGDIFLLDAPETASTFRLVGSRVTQWLGAEPTGRSFASIFGDDARDNARAALSVAAMEGEPILLGLRLTEHGAIFPPRVGAPAELARRMAERRDMPRFSGEMVLLPLFHQGRIGTRILGAIAFSQPLRDRPALPLDLGITGTRVLGRNARPASALGLVTGQVANDILLRRGHLTLMRGGEGSERG